MFNRSIAPETIQTEDVAEVIMLHQMACEFRQEKQSREAFDTYCEWYADTARTHQAELAAMGQDIPILNWFLGFKRKP